MATTEYSNLLRPLRGREPEGMWNLLQIVREMLARHDLNGTQLLDILTRQCLAQEQVSLIRLFCFFKSVFNLFKIIQWWFTTKVSNVYNERGTNGLKPHNTSLVQQASSALCDEIVQIWRLIALNPRLNYDERNSIYMKLCSWHLSIIERICKQKTTTTNISTTTNGVYTNSSVNMMNDRTLNQKRRDIDIFPGFLPAIEVCQIDWTDCPYYPDKIEENNTLNTNTRPWSEYIRSYDELLLEGYLKLNSNTSFNYFAQQQARSQPVSNVQEETNPTTQDDEINNANNNNDEDEKCQDVDSGEESCEGANGDQQSSSNSSDECRIYFTDQKSVTKRQKSKSSLITTSTTLTVEPYTFKILKAINDPLQVGKRKFI